VGGRKQHAIEAVTMLYGAEFSAEGFVTLVVDADGYNVDAARTPGQGPVRKFKYK